jgi:3-phosphoshikimate 1-carboxyvinyltransferase
MIIDYKEIDHNELEIVLPSSKSIANRALIIQALCLDSFELNELSDAEDTKILQSLIQNTSLKKDVGMAGTAARFLTAFLATQNATYLIKGDERMHKRPIKILLDALESLGLEIKYLKEVGFLPIEINGLHLKGGYVKLESSVSSQFVSALMMIAPVLSEGLTIELQGNRSSKPYIKMTQKIMEHFGIKIEINGNLMHIPEQNYSAKALTIESDWSAASYFYSVLALLDEGSLILKNTSTDSWQGDSIVGDIYYRLGIKTSRCGDDTILEKSEHAISYLSYDFSDCPDLAQTVICTCIGLGIEGAFTGLQTLRNKETDRILALQNELAKFNWDLVEQENGVFELQRSRQRNTEDIKIKTYKDHRMAMAFAPLSIIHGAMEIENPDVVIKSFPTFWNELKKIGIQ